MRIGLPKGTVKARSERLIEALTGERIEPRRLAYTRGPLTCFLLKHRDIPVLMKSGDLDLGITSTEWLAEKGPELAVLHRTDWCDTRISLVGTEQSHARVRSGDSFSCVTEFPVLARRYLVAHGLLDRARFVNISGSTEALVPRIYDVGIDCIETGETLAANGLIELDVLCQAHVVLVGLAMRRDTDALAGQIKEHLA
jgi:ATP phosphoribosyltransferase